MVGLYGADASGTMKTATGLYAADASGTMKQVTAGWAADASGTMKQFWPTATGPVLTVTSGSPSYLKASLDWRKDALGNDTPSIGVVYDIYRVGTATPINTQEFNYAIVDVTPATTTQFYVVKRGNPNQTSNTVSYTSSAVPVPANFKVSGISDKQATATWTAVSGATSYQIRNGTSAAFWTGTGTSRTTTGLVADTNYTWSIRAAAGSSYSGWSTGIAFKTLPVQVAPGVRTYNYSSYSSWQNGTVTSTSAWNGPKWRPKSDGAFAGNDAVVGGTRGDQCTFFFYSAQGWSALKGGTVTKLRIYMYRQTGWGSDTDTMDDLIFWATTLTGTLAGKPVKGTHYVGGGKYGDLNKGTGAWINLPVAWGQGLVNGTYKGIACGFSGNSHMRFQDYTSTYPTGRIEITIG